jgi:hypothetical protein
VVDRARKKNNLSQIEEFSKCDDFSGEISSAHRQLEHHFNHLSSIYFKDFKYFQSKFSAEIPN